METSLRILNSPHPTIFLKKFPTLLLMKPPSPKFLLSRSPPRIPHNTKRTKKQPPYYCLNPIASFPHSPLFTNSNNLSGFLLSSLSLSSPNPLISTNNFARITSQSQSPSQTKAFQWNFAFDGKLVNNNNNNDKGQEVYTVVLLGWLGSQQKHLRRYAELYNERGIHALTFVAPVRDLLNVDLGRRFEQRISELVVEIVSWLSSHEDNQRFLLFHTFSNTGWLAYGAILDDLQEKPHLLDRIKGCVFDSGGDPNIDPKVWAAGFGAALLKKRSSAIYPSVEITDVNGLESEMPASNVGRKQHQLVEVFLLSLLEKLFSFLLKLPDINERLTKIISVLSKKQPPCPQLYLYSTADKVIPFKSIESFIEVQKESGRKVWSFNFGSSPHVDHYRTFPAMYTSKLHNFLKECFAMVKQT